MRRQVRTPALTACVWASPRRTGTRWGPMSSMRSWAQKDITSNTWRTSVRWKNTWQAFQTETDLTEFYFNHHIWCLKLLRRNIHKHNCSVHSQSKKMYVNSMAQIICSCENQMRHLDLYWNIFIVGLLSCCKCEHRMWHCWNLREIHRKHIWGYDDIFYN